MFEREGTTASAGVLFWGCLFAIVSALMFGWYAPSFVDTYKQPLVDLDAAVDAARTLSLIGAYGDAGRHAYLVFLSLDCLFPVTASLFTIASYRALLAPLGVREARIKQLTVVPALAAVCDLAENTFFALITMMYPRYGEQLADLALVATGAKYVALVTTWIVFAVLIALWVQHRVASLKSSRS